MKKFGGKSTRDDNNFEFDFWTVTKCFSDVVFLWKEKCGALNMMSLTTFTHVLLLQYNSGEVLVLHFLQLKVS